MTHLEAKQGILKVDSRGRVQTPPERREALLDEFERCGLSGRRFAKMVGVVPVTVEKALKQAKAEPKVNEARRAAQSVPVLQRLHRVLLLLKNRRGILPQSGFGKAIRYALGEWESVLVYAGDGRVEIDKNPCERAIRFTAVGKKNCHSHPTGMTP